MARQAPPETIAAYAAAVEDAAAEAELVAALDALEAAALDVREKLYRRRIHVGYRAAAEQTGLTLHTVQRWSLDGPPVMQTLRSAAFRRGRGRR